MSLTINSWSFDQPVYAPGATITLTVNYTSTDVTSTPSDTAANITVTVSDSADSAVVTSDGSAAFPMLNTSAPGAETVDPTTVSVTDSRPTPGTWTLVSNTLADAAPFTGVAVLTSVA
jgi:hypothetical protein